jgi:glutaredoxin
MKKEKKYWLIIIILVVVVGLLILFLSGKEAKSELILFYSDSCPHCQNVEKYINDNGLKNKLKFQELEVSQNKANSSRLMEKARQCGLNTDSGIGVPFFFDGEKCLLGDQDIIAYLEKLKN